MADRYFGDSMQLSIQTESGTSITVGSLQNVGVVAESNEVIYYSADQTTIEDRKHTEKRLVVSATIGSWDTALLQQWLGGSGASSTGLVDTADPAEFEITGEVTPSGGGTNLKAVVSSVTFENMPMFEASRNEFLGKELDGTGSAITLTGP